MRCHADQRIATLSWPQVDAKTMRADLVPVTSAALERIKLLLLNMARQATLAVLDDILARIQQLAARPTQLDDFVNYMVSPVSWRILH